MVHQLLGEVAVRCNTQGYSSVQMLKTSFCRLFLFVAFFFSRSMPANANTKINMVDNTDVRP